ncbi:MAG: flagellar protein FlaG [Spirochaetaceae bacterium]|jgi:flagellar protein FlaG|nr:flagellar protein FlaG [Spirochaetaceae bacterium]
MGIQVASVGKGVSTAPLRELPQERGARQHEDASVRARTPEQQAAVVEQFTASLPENRKRGDIDSTLEDIEKISLAFNKRLKFAVDYQSHEVTVKVIDRETDKVIRELPPEELQRLHGKIREALGLLFDERI